MAQHQLLRSPEVDHPQANEGDEAAQARDEDAYTILIIAGQTPVELTMVTNEDRLDYNLTSDAQDPERVLVTGLPVEGQLRRKPSRTRHENGPTSMR